MRILLPPSLLSLLLLVVVHDDVDGHGTMIDPSPRQPESLYWYSVGCMIGCVCSGGGKETYPSLESVECVDPIEPTNNDALSWNVDSKSPREDWNRYMPFRSPGSSIPLDACGIASGFLPTAAVQFAHEFSSSVEQGTKGTHLPPGTVTTWTADSVVEASFSLMVNHGGGYQYRVCPKSEEMTNDCFEQNPLSFETDTHIVTTNQKTQTIEIPATDVSSGVRPIGSTWRRIPLPGCNCDIGSNCDSLSANDQRRSYADDDSNTAYGHCTTGLQFRAPHLEQSLWPEGYGYYVATLGGDDGGGKNNNRCSSYTNTTSCNEIDYCAWYVETNVCYETRKGEGKPATDMSGNPCPKQPDKASCLATSSIGDTKYTCAWYETAQKKVCYDKEQMEKNNNNAKESNDSKRRYLQKEDQKTNLKDNNDYNKDTTTTNKDTNNYNKETNYNTENKGNKYTAGDDYNWYITDKLRAPSVPGEYMLQWRWDNEQTPQIWTTCADIEVVGAAEVKEATSDATSSNILIPPLHFFFLATAAIVSLL